MATGGDKMAAMNRTRHLSVVLSGASLALGLLLLNAPAFAQTLPAAEAWLRIEHRYAEAPPADTVDTLKGGDPSTPVTGIATTFLDTMDVLREAVKRGDNLIITHEPTFYNHRDETAAFANDPVYKENMTRSMLIRRAITSSKECTKRLDGRSCRTQRFRTANTSSRSHRRRLASWRSR
jgi:hypothetical protein